MKTLVAGGPVIDLGEASIITGASWGENGFIVAAIGSPTHGPTQAPLSLFPEGGGAPQPLVSFTESEATHRWPQFLPGGEHVIFTAHRLLDTFDDANIRIVSVKTGAVKTLVRGGYSGATCRAAISFTCAAAFSTAPASIATRSKSPVARWRSPAMSGSTRLGDRAVRRVEQRHRYASVTGGCDLAAGVDLPPGTMQPLNLKPGTLYGPRISPDGKWIAFSGPISNGNIGVYEWERDKVTEVTGDAQGHFSPVWTPDGKHLVYRTYVQATGEFAWTGREPTAAASHSDC